MPVYPSLNFRWRLDSETAAIVARGIFNRLDADKEHFVVMGTNNKNQINGYKEISTGTLTSSLVSPGEVFLAALRLRAAAIICVHNHPSGDPMPSQEDQEITRRLKECGEMVGIQGARVIRFWEGRTK